MDAAAVGASHPAAVPCGAVMSLYLITLHLPGDERSQIAQVEAATPEEAASIIARQFPLLPPDYVWVGDRALTGLLAPPVAAPAARTKGLTLYRERVRRQKLAERWRQHWIDKDDARRKRA